MKYMHVEMLLKQVRQRKKVTLNKLSEKSGISTTHINDIENNIKSYFPFVRNLTFRIQAENLVQACASRHDGNARHQRGSFDAAADLLYAAVPVLFRGVFQNPRQDRFVAENRFYVLIILRFLISRVERSLEVGFVHVHVCLILRITSITQ